MTKKLLGIGCVGAYLCALVASGLAATAGLPQASSPAPTSPVAAAQRAILNQYCVSCHSQRAKTAGVEAAQKLTLDDLDVSQIAGHPDVWEKVVRKLRAGMMPPAGSRRPDKATY